MLLVNTETIQGKEFEVLGLVSGIGVPPVRMRVSTKGMGEVIEEGVERAKESMIKKAKGLGADAIINVRFDKESEVFVNIMVWGTAVKMRR
jgi:uncharacterized protein YbjQ (UPF0145 family)